MTDLAFDAPAVDLGGPWPETDLDSLIRQMAKNEGRRAAFTELHRRLHSWVVDYADWMLADRDGAERVARGTFVEAWHRAPDYQAGDGGAEGWILAIAHRRIAEAGVPRREAPAAAPQPSGEPPPHGYCQPDARWDGASDEHLSLELDSLLAPELAAMRAIGRRRSDRPLSSSNQFRARSQRGLE